MSADLSTHHRALRGYSLLRDRTTLRSNGGLTRNYRQLEPTGEHSHATEQVFHLITPKSLVKSSPRHQVKAQVSDLGLSSWGQDVTGDVRLLRQDGLTWVFVTIEPVDVHRVAAATSSPSEQ